MLCPFCFDDFPLREVEFRCISPPAKCLWETDTTFEDKWKDSTPMGKVIEAKARRGRNAVCPDCKGESSKRLCPKCHSELPGGFGDVASYIFAVIGAKQTGKSHYIAVLIDWIRRHGGQLDIGLLAANDATIKRYNDHFYKPVFEDGKTIGATQSGTGAGAPVRQPLVYRLNVFEGRDSRNEGIKKAAFLVFFDTAGEDLDAEVTMETVNKYIYRSAGIVLLVDPLQIEEVRKKLENKVALPERNAETRDILARTTNLVRNSPQWQGLRGKVPIPIAVTFSKIDAVEGLVRLAMPENRVSREEANHDGGIDLADQRLVSGEMESLVRSEWGGDLIVDGVRNWEQFAFFGVSALGCNPADTVTGNRIEERDPRRVEDPFVWLLYVNGLIGTASDSAGG